MATREIDAASTAPLETTRLRLERCSDAHCDDFARFMCDPAVIRWIRPAPLDRVRALEQHERSLKEWELFGFGKRTAGIDLLNAACGATELKANS